MSQASSSPSGPGGQQNPPNGYQTSLVPPLVVVLNAGNSQPPLNPQAAQQPPQRARRGCLGWVLGGTAVAFAVCLAYSMGSASAGGSAGTSTANNDGNKGTAQSDSAAVVQQLSIMRGADGQPVLSDTDAKVVQQALTAISVDSAVLKIDANNAVGNSNYIREYVKRGIAKATSNPSPERWSNDADRLMNKLIGMQTDLSSVQGKAEGDGYLLMATFKDESNAALKRIAANAQKVQPILDQVESKLKDNKGTTITNDLDAIKRIPDAAKKMQKGIDNSYINSGIDHYNKRYRPASVSQESSKKVVTQANFTARYAKPANSNAYVARVSPASLSA